MSVFSILILFSSLNQICHYLLYFICSFNQSAFLLYYFLTLIFLRIYFMFQFQKFKWNSKFHFKKLLYTINSTLSISLTTFLCVFLCNIPITIFLNHLLLYYNILRASCIRLSHLLMSFWLKLYDISLYYTMIRITANRISNHWNLLRGCYVKIMCFCM